MYHIYITDRYFWTFQGGFLTKIRWYRFRKFIRKSKWKIWSAKSNWKFNWKTRLKIRAQKKIKKFNRIFGYFFSLFLSPYFFFLRNFFFFLIFLLKIWFSSEIPLYLSNKNDYASKLAMLVEMVICIHFIAIIAIIVFLLKIFI